MNLLKDLWAHLKEWSDWKMKDWIKAAIVAVIVIIIIGAIQWHSDCYLVYWAVKTAL